MAYEARRLAAKNRNKDNDSGAVAVVESVVVNEPMMPSPDILWKKYQDMGSVHRVGDALGVCGETVRQKLISSGYRLDGSKWTKEELDTVINYYKNVAAKDFSIEILALRLKRSFFSVAIKASRMGLSDSGRKKSDTHIENCSKGQIERAISHPEDAVRRSQTMKKWHSENEHPKGFLGHKRTPLEKQRMSSAVKSAWSNPEHKFNSEEFRQKRSDISSKIAATRKSEKVFSRCKRGERKDIPGVFFRSSWEANYARYLNFLIRHEGLIENWEYEPCTFWFEEIKRGCRSYKPDFRVTFKSGKIEYHEVKGWMYPRAKTALKRMRIYHPEIEMILIDQNSYKEISKKLKRIIPNWE